MTTVIERIESQLEEQFVETVAWRRNLHKHPELSFKEAKTAQFIKEQLEELNLEVRDSVGGYGIIATLKGAQEGPTIAFRADFDALPITDLKEVDYKSINEGVSHACGHDGHTSALLGFAKVIQHYRDALKGNIVFIFQPAEETPPGGAKYMIEDGVLEGVDVIFGAHLDSSNAVGTVSVGDGYKMAAVDKFKITIQGLGGHGARPHESIDALVLGSKIVSDLQQIVARRLDPFSPAVVTLGVFHAGSAFNIIADSATIEGTVRTMTDDIRQKIKKEIYTIVEGATTAAYASFDIDYLHGYPALYNHPEETTIVQSIITNHMPQLTLEELEPTMGAEDFAYYLEKRPGTYFKVGSNNGDEATKYPHHHPKFDFDERALKNTQQVFSEITKYYLLQVEN